MAAQLGQLERATEQGQEQQRTRNFNPNEHLMQIKSGQRSSDYLPVQWRLVWFREKFPHGTIETELVHLDLDRDTEEEITVWEDRKPKKVIKHAKGVAVFRATVKDGMGGMATGVGSETACSFSDWIEKAETKSIGRALAALGFGTQFAGDEFSEQQRPVDAPVSNGNGATSNETHVPLANQIAQAKKRAKALRLATNAEEWQQMLSDLLIEEITTPEDMSVVDMYLDSKEGGA